MIALHLWEGFDEPVTLYEVSATGRGVEGTA